MNARPLSLFVSAAIAVSPDAGAAEPQEVQAPEPELAPLTNLVWRLPAKYATLEGDRLVVDIPADAYPASAMATAEVPAALLDGAEGFSMTVEAAGSGLAKPTQSWLGLKFQLHWRDGAGTAALPHPLRRRPSTEHLPGTGRRKKGNVLGWGAPCLPRGVLAECRSTGDDMKEAENGKTAAPARAQSSVRRLPRKPV